MEKEEKIKKVDGKSKDIWEDKLERLKQEFPEAISEDEVDCDQLKRLVGDESVADKERIYKLYRKDVYIL